MTILKKLTLAATLGLALMQSANAAVISVFYDEQNYLDALGANVLFSDVTTVNNIGSDLTIKDSVQGFDNGTFFAEVRGVNHSKGSLGFSFDIATHAFSLRGMQGIDSADFDLGEVGIGFTGLSGTPLSQLGNFPSNLFTLNNADSGNLDVNGTLPFIGFISSDVIGTVTFSHADAAENREDFQIAQIEVAQQVSSPSVLALFIIGLFAAGVRKLEK